MEKEPLLMLKLKKKSKFLRELEKDKSLDLLIKVMRVRFTTEILGTSLLQ